MPSCTQCQQSFEISELSQSLYQRLAPPFSAPHSGTTYPLPIPNLCPACRWQRRLAYRNERTLHRRECSLTGRSMVSMYPSDVPFPVYYISDWLSDKWDATRYGRSFDFSKPFFEQFDELRNTVPHFNLFIDPQLDENSDFTNCSDYSKNCYLISQASTNEDCFYSRSINSCKNCCDCLHVHTCELCYECINLVNCYHCLYSQDCENCSDCSFSSSLRGCKNCFGCHNLIQKEYHFFNQPLSRAEWEKRVKGLTLTPESIKKLRQESEEVRLKTPHRFSRILHSENCTGDHINHCRDCTDVFDSLDLEHCAYCNEVTNGAKFCMDFCMWGRETELLYECCGCGNGAYQLLCCNQCWQNVSYLLYCDSCFPAVSNCFGCFGLQRKRFCILNKQYSEEEYYALLPRIIKHLQETKEWGQFFPTALSPFGYNETMASEYFPLTQADVLQRGWKWRAIDEKTVTGDKLRNTSEQVLTCQESGRPFKLQKPELSFYQKLALPMPQIHPDLRHRRRIAQRNPRKLFKRFCEDSGVPILTTYAPDRPEIVYSEQSYLAAVC